MDGGYGSPVVVLEFDGPSSDAGVCEREVELGEEFCGRQHVGGEAVADVGFCDAVPDSGLLVSLLFTI